MTHNNDTTTRPGEAAAVEAVIDSQRWRVDDVTRTIIEHDISVAYPLIAAAVREQVAQEIEALDEPYWDTDGAYIGWAWADGADIGWAVALDDAARIARGSR